MSQQDIWAVVGRAKVDGDFASRVFHDLEGAVKEAGYSLSPSELQTLRAALSDGSAAPQQQAIPQFQEIADEFKFQQGEMRKRVTAQSDRLIDINDFTTCILKETIGHSASSYRKITLMNQVMFWMGVGLFVFAVIYAAFHDVKESTLFAGLGTTSFVLFFFLGPIKKTQAALSNLIQAEIAFMNYFEQLSLLQNYADMPREDAPGLRDPARMERASELLQQRSQQTMDLLQRYLEDDPKSSEPLAIQGKASAG